MNEAIQRADGDGIVRPFATARYLTMRTRRHGSSVGFAAALANLFGVVDVVSSRRGYGVIGAAMTP